MYCPDCKQSFPDNERFCSDCGRPLEETKKGTLWIPAVVLSAMFAAGLLVWCLL
jgi:predicted amidophosphoribosyltransferase